MQTNKIDIMKWLNSCNVKDYHVHDNLVVDVNNCVDIFNQKLIEIPVQFGVVKGYFDCSQNKLTSLKGLPHTLHGNLNCALNNLKSLDYLPQTIKGYIYCAGNPIVHIDNITTCVFDLDFYHNNASYIDGFSEFYIADQNENDMTKLKMSYKEIQVVLLNRKFNENIIQKPTTINSNKKIKFKI